MGTMTAANQQYYGASYPAVAQASQQPNYQHQQHPQQHQATAYEHLAQHHQQHQPSVTAYHHHHHHQQQSHQHLSHHHQQQQHHTQYHHQTQHQLQNQQHHHQQQQQLHPMTVVASTTSQLTQLGAQTQTQRTVSASTNSSGALYGPTEATKSTKGASKERRDRINEEIAKLRELLPLPASTRQRLSQLQLMALVLVYVRKSNYFCNAFRNYGIALEPSLGLPASGFSKALNGFLMMLTQKGKLLYISDNAAEYLGHSMEDLLSHGDEVYDIIEEQDKKTIRTELLSNDDDHHNQSSPSSKSLQHSPIPPSTEPRIALCRMNVSRNARRQMRFGDQKVVLIEGHYFGYLPLSSRNEPVFLATCTPIAMPETRECVVQGSTNVFVTIHSMDMKFLYIDRIGEHYLGFTREQIQGTSWYDLIHNDHLHEAQTKHKRITANDQERSTIVLLRFVNSTHTSSVWVHSVLQVKEPTDSGSQPVIMCTNQVLSEREAQVMRANTWLYQFYSLHSKMHCNFSSSSPLNHINQTETPNSVCSDLEERGDLKPMVATTTKLTSISASVSADMSKSPPATSNGSSNQGTVSPDRLSRVTAFNDNYSNSTSSYGSSYQHLQKGAASKLSPIIASTATHSPSSSSSTISTSPLSVASSAAYLAAAQQQQVTAAAAAAAATSQQQYHQLTSSCLTNNPLGATLSSHHHSGVDQQQQHHHHQQQHGSVGSSSASSTSSSISSSSSTSSLSNQNESIPSTPATASTTAVAAAAAASLYASIDGIDPLHHMHHSAAAPLHHHHSATMYSAAGSTGVGQHHPASHHHHAAAAVNYANQVMAAQRVAHQQHPHHHHHPYHPYQHHHHHHQPSHVAPHHHNHHTTPAAAAALYAPAHRHVSAAAASSAALNNAFNHHHHAAAYHSAVAQVQASHPAHNPAATNIQNPYHTASAATAAAAAAAHQGVSFHYNKILNASA